MRSVLGLLLVSLAATPVVSAEPAPAAPVPVVTPEQVAQALHDLTQGKPVVLPQGVTIEAALAQVAPAPPAPDLARPAPVPAERAPQPPPVPRVQLPTEALRNAMNGGLTEPPVVPEGASAELLSWSEHLEGKLDRRIARGGDIGGLAAIGVRLGGAGQIDELIAAGVPEGVAAGLRAWNQEGALVISVVPGSPSEQAGLQPGDVIVQYAGVWIDATNLLIRIASRSVVGQEQEIWVLRAGEIERLWLTPIDRRDLESR